RAPAARGAATHAARGARAPRAATGARARDRDRRGRVAWRGPFDRGGHSRGLGAGETSVGGRCPWWRDGMTKEATKTKFIFVTGGVVSSLGKGVASASIGALLEARGLTVTIVKADPYINVDPGTMSPF